MGARLRYSVPWLVAGVACAGCSALLDMAAPQLADVGDASLLEASSIDVGSGEATSPGTPDAGADASFDAAVDVGLDAAVVDARGEAAVDAAVDQSADAPNGLPCGYSLSCAQFALPYCCETTDDAGTSAFACVSSESACSGYYIECANENDCPNSEICCHYSSAMRCETPSQSGACPGGSTTQACDPANNGECPAREACTLQLTINNMPTPYLGCQ